MACGKYKKHDFQIMQNDILRICENKKLEDRISIEDLHKKAKILSLEQRRAKQLLILMYKLSKNDENRAIANHITRKHTKYVFKVETKIGTKYSNSPYYKGTLLWEKLDTETLDLECLVLFKKILDKLYNKFDVKMII